MTLNEEVFKICSFDIKDYRSDKADGKKATHCFIPGLHVWAVETILSSVATSPQPKPL